MGPLEQIVGMLPGMGGLKQLTQNAPDQAQLGRIEGIIHSMTPEERRNQKIMNGSRRKRIARGSGVSVEEVNRLLRQFAEMRKMLKAFGGVAGGGGRKKLRHAMSMLRNRGIRA
jgi:signal recognition particle subunit SRP54